ncbi:hypothetical protein L596_008382 [Steinernema carpocapsae]|uniref:Nucleoporin NUP35 n=1 Tax=Steinernema carpocapsae TaxID=34508 RepID=A0A4U5PCK7_STECR|nr:hypothetical protein L596_008382 [Steinernema carpocapsae]
MQRYPRTIDGWSEKRHLVASDHERLLHVPARSMDVDEPFSSVVPQLPSTGSHMMAGEGPPLRTLGAEYQNAEVTNEKDLSAYEDALDAKSEKEDAPEREFWVKAFGHQPHQIELVLKVLAKHGSVVSYRIPESGNWILLRYSTVTHAARTIAQSGMYGMFLDCRTIIGIVECEQEDLIDSEGRNVSCLLRTENTINESVFSPQQGTSQPEDTLSQMELKTLQGRPGIRSLIAANAVQNVFAQQPNESSFLNKIWNFIA